MGKQFAYQSKLILIGSVNKTPTIVTITRSYNDPDDYDDNEIDVTVNDAYDLEFDKKVRTAVIKNYIDDIRPYTLHNPDPNSLEAFEIALIDLNYFDYKPETYYIVDGKTVVRPRH